MSSASRSVAYAQCWCGKFYMYTPIVELANGMRMTCGEEGCEPPSALDAYADVFPSTDPYPDPYAALERRWYPTRVCGDLTIHVAHRFEVNDNPTDYDPWNPPYWAQCPGREDTTNQ